MSALRACRRPWRRWRTWLPRLRTPRRGRPRPALPPPSPHCTAIAELSCAGWYQIRRARSTFRPVGRQGDAAGALPARREGQTSSDGLERALSLAHTFLRSGLRTRLLACTHACKTDTGACIAYRGICLACTCACKTDTGACIAYRGICLARTGPRTSRKCTVPTRVRLVPARTTVCRPCTRIPQARTHACRRAPTLFLKK